MKLWLISQSENNSYDSYDSAVVTAETEEEARVTNPGGEGATIYRWSDKHQSWMHPNGEPQGGLYGDRAWTHPQYVSVEYLGDAKDGTPPSVICASFNAG